MAKKTGMKVELISHTPNPDRVCAAAAMGCYSSRSSKEHLGRFTDEDVRRVLKKTVSAGHHSVIEHAVFTFSISGVSRALTHQLVRHRMASYSQQSQRYVEAKKPEYVTPPSIAGRPAASKAFEKAVEHAWENYRALLAEDVDPEDARFVLPNAAATKITVTMNARELQNFFRLRLCLRAQWEIRQLALIMLKAAKKAAPAIFAGAGPNCRSCREEGPCPRKRQAAD